MVSVDPVRTEVKLNQCQISEASCFWKSKSMPHSQDGKIIIVTLNKHTHTGEMIAHGQEMDHVLVTNQIVGQ